MVKVDNGYFQCEICKLHYDSYDLASECQKWCSSHNSCNYKIASMSREASKLI
ncbi:MAG: hypothetical protein OH318_00910 [Candidatus Parvarchaeota archaeon]|nr:hypothetical protein [Candidatus Rehaiarchaeum fermentans]